MPTAQAQPLAQTIATIPVGTISPREVPGADILIFQPAAQGGRYSLWGVDVTLGWQASDLVSVTAGYSFASKDSTDLGGSAGHLLFQTPRHKGNLSIDLRDLPRGYRGYLRGRAAAAFSVSSPAYVGRVDAFAVFDAGVGVRLPRMGETWLSLDALNLFDHEHAEFVGTPEIGRLLMSRLSVTF
jgi:hypothetical protein